MTLRCHLCKQEKPVTEFYRNPDSKTGYHHRCKACDKREESFRGRGGWNGFWKRMSRKKTV